MTLGIERDGNTKFCVASHMSKPWTRVELHMHWTHAKLILASVAGICFCSAAECSLCRAVALGASGRIFFGVNLEFARLPLYNSVHAEQFLVANALHHGERELRKLAVSAAPCGHCRQFFSELSCAVSLWLACLSHAAFLEACFCVSFAYERRPCVCRHV